LDNFVLHTMSRAYHSWPTVMWLFITRCIYVGLHLIENSFIHGCNEKHNYDGKLVPWVLLVPLPSLSILFSSYSKYSCTADALPVSASRVSAFILYSYTSSYMPLCASLMILSSSSRSCLYSHGPFKKSSAAMSESISMWSLQRRKTWTYLSFHLYYTRPLCMKSQRRKRDRISNHRLCWDRTQLLLLPRSSSSSADHC